MQCRSGRGNGHLNSREQHGEISIRDSYIITDSKAAIDEEYVYPIENFPRTLDVPREESGSFNGYPYLGPIETGVRMENVYMT